MLASTTQRRSGGRQSHTMTPRAAAVSASGRA